jgi:dTDP-glucose pyrophosphorylase
MKYWKEALIHPDISINDAIKTITAASFQIALVVDNQQKLLGTVTDGDIRRGILKGICLSESVQKIMNSNPTIGYEGEDPGLLRQRMQAHQHRHIPIVNKEGCIVELELLDSLLKQERSNWVLLMAGGLGTRLKPLTEDCPKPLLNVGNKPLLETIVSNFSEHGFKQFYITVNYKSEMVVDHFKDGSKWGVDIRYIREDERMGTAGALSLLPELPKEPMLVMNADILTKVNFHQLLDFHREQKAQATMCVREYDFQVPYGVVTVDDHRILKIDEKPVHRFFVNAGIYVLDPDTLEYVPKNRHFDMPSLFERFIEKDVATSVFPLREYWLDIGHIDDFKRANGEYPAAFSDDSK